MPRDSVPQFMSEQELKALPSNAKLAIIYCRISDPGQTGLGSQEQRCNQYAAAKEYAVVGTVHDSVTGGGDFLKREGMVALLKFMDTYPERNFIVIFDDLKRYARDTEFHLHLRRVMLERGAIRECLNFNFEDSPEGVFNETINAAAGQLERQTNARQSRQKKIARLQDGYAIYNHPPIGYKFVKQTGAKKNKVLIRDEPYASIVQEALEGFASGRFSSQSELTRWLEAHPMFPKHTSTGGVRQQRVNDMLTQYMYAGYVSSLQLGVPLTPAKHRPLVSKATFEKIQKRLNGTGYAPARKDIHRDFVLRGAVACGCCGNNLRSGWTKGNTKKYAYYLCQTKGCDLYGKSIARAKLEEDFGKLLATVQPNENMAKLVIGMFKKYWNMKVEQAKTHTEVIKAEIKDAELQISKLVDRIVNTTNDRAVAALEDRIGELEKQKLILAEKVQETTAPQPTFNEKLELSLKFFANPYKLWDSGKFELRRLVLKLVFKEPVRYCKKQGTRTPATSLPFNVLGGNMAEISAQMLDGAAERN